MPYSNGKIDEIYNGRFLFIKPTHYNKITADFLNIKKHFDPLIKLYQTPSGHAINGARWIIRQLFIYTENKSIVEIYYKLRFLWFFINNIEENIFFSKKMFSIKSSIKKEFRVVFFMLSHELIPTLLLILSIPITIPIGFFLNKHFTVYAFAKDKEVIFEYGMTTYTSSLEKQEKIFDKFMRWVVNIVQHKYILNKKPWIIKNWVHIKFKTEMQMFDKYNKINKNNPAFPDFDTYQAKIIAFAIAWSGCTDIKKSREIANVIFQLSETSDIDLSEIKKKEYLEEWNKVLGFFYMHGN